MTAFYIFYKVSPHLAAPYEHVLRTSSNCFIALMKKPFANSQYTFSSVIDQQMMLFPQLKTFSYSYPIESFEHVRSTFPNSFFLSIDETNLHYQQVLFTIK